MALATGRIRASGDGEVLQLPLDVAYGREIDVTIVRSGDVLTIYPTTQPARRSGAELVRALAELPKPDRVEVRDTDWWPERPGL